MWRAGKTRHGRQDGKCWQILMACGCAGIDGRMKTIIPRPNVEPAPLSGWFFFFCFHLCAFVFIYCFIIRVCFGCSDSIILFLLFLWWIWELVLFASALLFDCVQFVCIVSIRVLCWFCKFRHREKSNSLMVFILVSDCVWILDYLKSLYLRVFVLSSVSVMLVL